MTPDPYLLVIKAFTRIVEEKPDLLPEVRMKQIVANLEQELPAERSECCNKIWQLVEDSPELKNEFSEMQTKIKEEFQSSSLNDPSRAPGSGKSGTVPATPDEEREKLLNAIQLRYGLQSQHNQRPTTESSGE